MPKALTQCGEKAKGALKREGDLALTQIESDSESNLSL